MIRLNMFQRGVKVVKYVISHDPGVVHIKLPSWL